MLILLSPSKTQEIRQQYKEFSRPQHLAKVEILVRILKNFDISELCEIMHISEKLARTTFERFSEFEFPPDMKKCAQALIVFQGDVFTEIDVDNYDKNDFQFAQKHLRILSGLYGVLRPLDLIQPYRLEIGGKFRPEKNLTLYDYWRDAITTSLNKIFIQEKNPVLLNLASNEYFKAIGEKKLQAEIINVFFKQKKDGKLRTVAIHAKKARGALADYIIRNQLVDVSTLTSFNYNGYHYDSSLSTQKDLVFVEKSGLQDKLNQRKTSNQQDHKHN